MDPFRRLAGMFFNQEPLVTLVDIAYTGIHALRFGCVFLKGFPLRLVCRETKGKPKPIGGGSISFVETSIDRYSNH